jgi:hypothetical protein
VVANVDPLSVAALLAAANEGTGLTDLGEDGWEEGLDRLLHSLRAEADLNEIGVQVATASLLGALEARLRVTDWHRRHPEIGAATVPAPVAIVGQPRTGTTILFDLLAQDGRFRVPLTWEVAQPHPPPETATYDTDPRIEASAAGSAMTEALVPGFQAIHPSGPRRGQECVAITAGDFRSLLYSTVFHVPDYTRWLLLEADMAPAYRYHRRFLQLLQWRHPGERWLLKTPGHQWCLDALFAEYPDATIVHTHRDPLKVLASTASLTAQLQRMASDHTSIRVQASEWVEHLVVGNDRSVDARQNGTVAPSQAVDIHFGELMSDTFGSISTLYDRLGVPLTASAESRMRAFLADNPSDKHGVHRYTFSATGLDEHEVRGRTARYETYFGVPREHLG